MRRIGFALVTALLSLSCGDDSSSQNGPLQPLPPADGQQLATLPYTVNPGEEKYFCYTFHSPKDPRGIIAVQPIEGTIVHHMVLFHTLVPEKEGFSECPVLIKQTWLPIWAGGRNTNGITLPDGVAFNMDADEQYLVQLHLLNAGAKPVTERTGINLTYAPAGANLTPAGIYAFGSFNVDLPAGAMGVQKVISCSAPHDMHVFATFPHMHKLGKKLEFVHGTTQADATMQYAKDPWVFGDQPMDPVDFVVKTGDFAQTTCTWDNTTNAEVKYGESTSDEMCFFLLFYYPYTQLGGCVH
jgi:copper type II ascorbate-dependent monooxygenase-like protein